jgi:hypothetical protein
MGGLAHLPSFRGIARDKKFSARRAAFARSANLHRGNNTIRSLYETLQGCPADLVFHLDEVGISDWDDRKPKKVVVPISVAAHNIHHRISRNVKHVSIVTCISAGGACLIPYLVTSQDSTALHRALEATGMQIGKHLILKQRAKPDVNADLFENDVRTVFLPHLAITRIMQNVRNGEIVLLMDNCSPHLTSILSWVIFSRRLVYGSLLSHPIQPKSSTLSISPCLELVHCQVSLYQGMGQQKDYR